VKHRPCGECGKLVPGDTGCPHWRPKKTPTKKAAPATRRTTGPSRVGEMLERTGKSYR